MNAGRTRDRSNGRVYVEGTVIEAREHIARERRHRSIGALVAGVIVVVFVALAARRAIARGAAI